MTLEILGKDSGEYHILVNAAKETAAVKGFSIEVGLREGGGSQCMMSQYDGHHKTHIALDPYGSLPYFWKEGQLASWIYDNSMRNKTVAALYSQTIGTNINFLFVNLTDVDYFSRFGDGVPIYTEGYEEKMNLYSCVHLDAEHTVSALSRQIDFFGSRTSNKGMIVIDDVTFFDIGLIETQLFSHGFKVFDKGSVKGAYQRVDI